MNSWLTNRELAIIDGAVDATRNNLVHEAADLPRPCFEPAPLQPSPILYSASERFEPMFKGRGLLVSGMRNRVGGAR
jgi:hypothetical protein